MKLFLKVFLTMFIPVTLVMAAIFFLSQSMILTGAEYELHSEMRNKWYILEQLGFESDYSEELNEKIHTISQRSPLRVTLIKKDGTVVYDSYLKEQDVAEMENHLDRSEVQDAMFEPEGYSRRRSATTGLEMLYYAKQLPNDRILRIAYPVTYMEALKRQNMSQHMALFVFFMLSVGVISLYIARKISLPVKKLHEIAEDIENEREVHFPEFTNPEIGRIAGLIYRIYSSMQQKKETLAEEREKLSHILEVLDEGIILLGKNAVVLHVTPKAEALLNCKLVENESIFKDQTSVKSIAFFRELTDSKGGTSQKKEFNGKVLDIYTRKFGQDTTLFVLHDVTERMQYENYKTEMVSNISHELKTPVAMIMGYAETVLTDDSMPTETRKKFLERIYNGSNRLNNMINDIITLLRLESTQQDMLHVEKTNLEDLCNELGELYGSEPNHTVAYHQGAGFVGVDYEHLISLITNLVDNAISYSAGRHIDVYFSVDVSLNTVKIAVADEGPVIPREERERIFERFYTISKSRSRQKSGTGLGLSIVKHICRLYHGKVVIRENEKSGNTFEVILVQQKVM